MNSEESQDGQERYENKISQLHAYGSGSVEKRKKNAKSNLTWMLNQFVVLITDEKYDRHKIVEGNGVVIRHGWLSECLNSYGSKKRLAL